MRSARIISRAHGLSYHKDCKISFFPTLYGREPECKSSKIRVTEVDIVEWEILSIDSYCRQHTKYIFLQAKKTRALMALVTRQEQLRAKSSYGMSSNKILRIKRLI